MTGGYGRLVRARSYKCKESYGTRAACLCPCKESYSKTLIDSTKVIHRDIIFLYGFVFSPSLKGLGGRGRRVVERRGGAATMPSNSEQIR